MKCDELKDMWFNAYPSGEADDGVLVNTLVYGKKEVDEAIAELKEKLAEEREFGVNRAKAADHDIGKLCVDVKNLNDQLRATKRALWLARAERAKETQFLWQVYCHCDRLYFCKPFCVSTRKNPYRYISRMNVVEWDEFWGKIKNKCLAKAEEYK